jgi:4'-phosphopantetheinyl transferase
MEPAGIHVWSLDLDTDPEPAAAVLSDEELARARRLRISTHRDRFVVCRGALRRILGTWLNIPAADVEFQYGAFGKPLLRDRVTPHFNVTHSEHRALIAICQQHPVGIDIERVRQLEDFSQLAIIVFNDRERRQMEALSSSEKAPVFFRGWSRKEAYFKATGAGLSAQLHGVTVDLEGECRILDICADDVGRWSMQDVPTPAGFVGAVAVRCAGAGFVFHEEAAASGRSDPAAQDVSAVSDSSPVESRTRLAAANPR